MVDGLRTSGWTVLHDVPWPGRQRANIDHVVVGPGGVFVVDAKNWSGRIEVRDGRLRQNGYSRHEALDGVARATVAVMQLHPRVATHGVLCLVDDEPRREDAQGVVVCSSASLLDVLWSAPAVLAPDQVAAVSLELTEKLRSEASFEALPRRRRGSTRRTVHSGSSRRSLVGLLVGVVLIAGVATGTFSKAAELVSGFVANVVVDADTHSTPSPKQKGDQERKQRGQREQK
ncbi:NERD domain-containing protein [Nocardioides sp. GXQ0305]|uniref:NERD domain-containing protein n=1 Tax=Nocardioides sp. GXQ0305 TaxID=3423912 RepID=UPI003D7E3722